jgi:multisubunit Na+/H+ antiporter MnhG subunit
MNPLSRVYAWLETRLASKLLFRRLILLSALIGAWPLADRLTQVEVLTKATVGGASIGVAVIGVIGLVIKLYIDMRDRDGD